MVTGVQLIPSVEVIAGMLRFARVATNRPLPKATPGRRSVVPLVRGVHTSPSGDVTITPLSPTAMKRPLPKTTLLRPAVVLVGLTAQWLCPSPSVPDIKNKPKEMVRAARVLNGRLGESI